MNPCNSSAFLPEPTDFEKTLPRWYLPLVLQNKTLHKTILTSVAITNTILVSHTVGVSVTPRSTAAFDHTL